MARCSPWWWASLLGHSWRFSRPKRSYRRSWWAWPVPSSAWWSARCSGVKRRSRMRRLSAAAEPVAARASPLARIVFLVYVLLVAYASLYPLAGWRDVGVSPFAYLSAPWPRYVTGFDIAVNVAGYVPFGFLAAAALHPRVRGVAAFLLAVVCASGLSLALEAIQTYLPARFPANVDVLCNLAGAAFGAALGLQLAPLIAAGPLQRRRAQAFLPGAEVHFGL